MPPPDPLARVSLKACQHFVFPPTPSPAVGICLFGWRTVLQSRSTPVLPLTAVLV